VALIRWDRPRGVVHNVATALAFGSDGCNVLVLSDAALYVVQNLVGLDAAFVARWADEATDSGYHPISEQSANYEAWHDMVLRIQAECMPVTCDLVAQLETLNSSQTAIAGALGELQAALEALTLPDYTSELGAIQAAIRDQQLCCGPIADLPYSPAPPDPEPNPETSTFCDRAWSFARDWADAAGNLFDAWIAAETLGIGVVAIIVGALTLPVAIIIGIVGALAALVLEVTKDNIIDAANSLVPDIACAVYTSASASVAKGAIDEVLDNADYPTGWVPLATEVLKLLVGFDALNTIFLETYTIRIDSADSSCAGCLASCVEELLVTAVEQPWNEVDFGGPVEQSGAVSSSGGWRTNFVGGTDYSVIIGFTPDSDVSSLRIACYLMANASQETTYLQILSHPDHTVLATTDLLTVSAINPAQQYEQHDLAVELTNGVRYDLRMTETPINSEVWINRVLVCKLT
jgi:hypothetical protein